MITCSKIAFNKYQGAGNDFIIIDKKQLSSPLEQNHIVHLCSRQYGIGADGLALVSGLGTQVLQMEFFNADGKSALMCGNALRCVAEFGFTALEKPGTLEIALGGKTFMCSRKKEGIEVVLGPPVLKGEGQYTLLDEVAHYHHIDTGVEHVVFWTSKELLESSEFQTLAKQVRLDKRFAPGGVNVSFARCQKQNHILMRTFEKGVEGETLACGSGAAAAVYSMHLKGEKISRVAVEFFSKEVLYFTSRVDEHGLINCWTMTGAATLVFHGTISL